MDKELEKIVREAHSMGATESDLNQIVDTYKKKSISVTGSQDGFQPSLTGSKPFQAQVPTEVPSVLNKQGRVGYEQEIAKPRPKEKPILDFSAFKNAPKPRDAYYQDPTIAAREEKARLKKIQTNYEEGPWLTNAINQGLLTGELANKLPTAGDALTPENLANIAEINSKLESIPQSEAQKEFQKSGFAIFKNPLLGAQFLTETVASSLAGLYEAGKRTVPLSVSAGAGTGAFFGGVGALPGAGIGLTAGLSSAGLNLSTSSDIMQSLKDSGVDVTNKDSLIKAFSDEKKMSQIRTNALKYGVPIMVFDMATAGIAGKLIKGAAGKSIAKKMAAGFGEAGIQATGGMAGELSGQALSGKKIDWNEVGVEGIASVFTDIPDVVVGSLTRDKSSSNNKNIAAQINKFGAEKGAVDAKINLDRDLANGTITPDEYEQGIEFIGKAVVANEKIPIGIEGDSREKSIELISKKDDILLDIEELNKQKEGVDDSFYPAIDEQIKAKEAEVESINKSIQETAKPTTGQATAQPIQEDLMISPETSSNYANMTEDDKGNFVFFHVGNKGYETIKPGTGASTVTSREEASALSKVGGLGMYYTDPNKVEKQSAEGAKYAVKIPKEKVYDFNTDKLNLIEEAEARHEAENPGKAFDINSQLAYVTKIAGEKGFDMVVAQWNNMTRAQTTKELTPTDIQESEGNVIKKAFNEKYESNKEKGFEPVVPVAKSEKLQKVYDKIEKVRDKEQKYDNLYRLYYESNKYNQDEITELINNSDLPQEIKDEYKEILESKEETRRSQQTKPKEDAIQKQTAGQVPVQPEAPVGKKVEQGKPEAKPKGVTEEGKEAAIETLQERINNKVYKDPDKSSRWRIKGSNFTYSSKNEAVRAVESEYKRDLFELEQKAKLKSEEGGKAEEVTPAQQVSKTKNEFQYVIDKANKVGGNIKGSGTKKINLSDRETAILNKTIEKLEEKAVKNNGASFDPNEIVNIQYENIDGKEQKINTYTVDGYSIKYKYSGGKSRTEITTPQGDLLIVSKQYGKTEISYLNNSESLLSKEQTPAQQVVGKKVKVENAPKGNHLNIGLNEGRTKKKMSGEGVLSKLPKDVKVISSVEIDVAKGEPTLVVETSRPLTDLEMAKLLGDTKQQAIPQLSNGEGVLYDAERGTKDGWGEFDPNLFILQDGKNLSEYAKGLEVTPVKPIADLKQDVKKARGKEAKANALQTLKENSTPEDFKAFMDDNPVYQKYEVKAEPVVEQDITDTTEIELPAEKKSVSKYRLAELEKQKNELLKKIRKAGANLSSGFNPEVIGDLVKLGAIYVEEGIITFKDFAAQLKKDYGKDIPEDIARDVFRKSAAVSGLGIRRTPERIGTGEGVSPILKEVANETNALYQKQDYKEIQDRLDSMSEADKNTLVGTLANVTGQLNAEGNVGVLAAIDLINMYEANGDKAGAQRVFDTISKSATAFAQLLRQYGQLKSSTPQGYVSIVTKYMKDKYNIDLNDAQKQEIEKLYNDSKKAIDINADALNDLADNLTDPNYDGDNGYKVWGESTVLLEDANRKLADYIDSLKPATSQSLFQKLTSIVQGNLLSLKSLLLNPVANAAQAGIKLSNNEVANLLDFVLNTTLKTGRTKISGFDPLAIRLGSKAFVRGLAKANRMLMRGATDTDLAKIDITGRLKPVEAWKSLYRSLRGKQAFELVKTIEDLTEGTIGTPANLALRLLPYGDLPRNEQVKIAKLIEIGRNKFGLKGKELEAFTLRPDPESLAEAELEGDKSTLQEPNKVYTFLNSVINSIDSKAEDKFVKGLLSGIKFVVRGTIVPFLKTPINYAAKAVRFTNPVIPYSQATYHMVKAIQAAKNIKNPILRESAIRKHQSKLTEYLGEAVIAQSIMSGALILIGYGLVTGDAPEEQKDKKEKDLMYQSLGPNMINISGLKRLLTGGDPAYKPGDTAIAYNALGILGAQLGISSNTLTTKEKENIRKQKFVTTEGKEFYKEDRGFYLSSIQAMSSNLPASLNFTLNQGFAQGTGTLLASIQDNQYSKWSNQMVKTLVTGLNVPNTVYQSLKAGNDYYRNVYTEDQVNTWGNIVKERYGNIEDLPINYDMWGKPIKLTPEGSNPYFYHVLDIFRTQKILQDKNTYFVFDLYKKTGDKSVIPTSVTDIIDEEGGVYTKLTSAQKSELQRLVGEERAKYVDGKKSGALSMKNYDPNNDNEAYWAKQVEKLKNAYELGRDIGKRRFEKEILSKTKK
jgi:hypothetical protein